MNRIEEMVAKFRERFESSEKAQEFVDSIKKAEEEKAERVAMFKEHFEAFRAKMANANVSEDVNSEVTE